MKRLSLIDKAFILKASPIFSQLDLDLLLPIVDKLSVITCDTGDVIFNVGEEAHRMYFTVKGIIAIYDYADQKIATIETHDFFGEEALFNERPRAYSAQCQTEAQLLVLSHTNLLTIISECPSVAISLLQAFAATTPFRYRKIRDSH